MLASFETNGAAANTHGEGTSTYPSSTKGEPEHVFDPARLLATFGNTPSVTQTTVRVKSEDVDTEQVLASLARSLSLDLETRVEAHASITAEFRQPIDAHPLAADQDLEVRFQKLWEELHTPTVQTPQAILGDDDDKDPRSMLAAIEKESALAHANDPKWMLAELERDVGRDNNKRLEAFRARLVGALPPSPGHTSGAQKVTEANTTSTAKGSDVDSLVALDKNFVPYVVALQLEIAGLPWEELQGWTTYLFSEGFSSYKACQERDAIVKRADEELNETIAQVTEESKHYLSIQNKARLPCRVIISNIAAGAEVEDLQEFFHSFRFVW
jgi:hypothetical protein